jgi:hypothetical protein
LGALTRPDPTERVSLLEGMHPIVHQNQDQSRSQFLSEPDTARSL